MTLYEPKTPGYTSLFLQAFADRVRLRLHQLGAEDVVVASQDDPLQHRTRIGVRVGDWVWEEYVDVTGTATMRLLRDLDSRVVQAYEEHLWPFYEGVKRYVLECAKAFDVEGYQGTRKVYLSPKELECLLDGMEHYVSTGGVPVLYGCELHVRVGG